MKKLLAICIILVACNTERRHDKMTGIPKGVTVTCQEIKNQDNLTICVGTDSKQYMCIETKEEWVENGKNIYRRLFQCAPNSVPVTVFPEAAQ